MSRMKLLGKKSQKCRCCGEHRFCNFFEWKSLVTKDFLGEICRKCAIREMFGTKWKANKRYKKWEEEGN